ncbi:hypothetical protein [Streptomyces himalayensis]|uniref:Uncharacterized protein n=1 Tax=Streptomyces himalayensis subsp. himalayensis TaxID=2756131 RepID=A0A7W0DUS4_9ACTN|nr:hypothetical protein [Streptomyces himalayensis]MBA2951627.1 hypothetical protein [Streptomyces himalayensis subsp. himalayensis]
MTGKSCANDWCTRPHHAKGYCQVCYRRGWAAGDMTRAQIRYENWGQSRNTVDEVAVERLCAGDIPEETTLGEREAAVRRLHALGWNDVEIEARLRRPPQYVLKVRRRLGLPPNQIGGRRTGQVYVTARDQDRQAPTSSSQLLPHPWLSEARAVPKRPAA